jgi:hypothetical protein
MLDASIDVDASSAEQRKAQAATGLNSAELSESETREARRGRIVLIACLSANVATEARAAPHSRATTHPCRRCRSARIAAQAFAYTNSVPFLAIYVRDNYDGATEALSEILFGM